MPGARAELWSCPRKSLAERAQLQPRQAALAALRAPIVLVEVVVVATDRPPVAQPAALASTVVVVVAPDQASTVKPLVLVAPAALAS